MSKEQIIEVYPSGTPFKIWCDGEVFVIKNMRGQPLSSRRLEYGKVRLKSYKEARVEKEKFILDKEYFTKQDI